LKSADLDQVTGGLSIASVYAQQIKTAKKNPLEVGHTQDPLVEQHTTALAPITPPQNLIQNAKIIPPPTQLAQPGQAQIIQGVGAAGGIDPDLARVVQGFQQAQQDNAALRAQVQTNNARYTQQLQSLQAARAHDVQTYQQQAQLQNMQSLLYRASASNAARSVAGGGFAQQRAPVAAQPVARGGGGGGHVSSGGGGGGSHHSSGGGGGSHHSSGGSHHSSGGGHHSSGGGHHSAPAHHAAPAHHSAPAHHAAAPSQQPSNQPHRVEAKTPTAADNWLNRQIFPELNRAADEKAAQGKRADDEGQMSPEATAALTTNSTEQLGPSYGLNDTFQQNVPIADPNGAGFSTAIALPEVVHNLDIAAVDPSTLNVPSNLLAADLTSDPTFALAGGADPSIVSAMAFNDTSGELQYAAADLSGGIASMDGTGSILTADSGGMTGGGSVGSEFLGDLGTGIGTGTETGGGFKSADILPTESFTPMSDVKLTSDLDSVGGGFDKVADVVPPEPPPDMGPTVVGGDLAPLDQA
jgi:hypothetical protein